MPATSKSDLLSWVISRWKPSVAQFKAWMNSYRHLEDAILLNDLHPDLQAALQNAAGVTNDFKILYYNTDADLPAPGSNKVLYAVLSTSALYVWNGTGYQQVGGGGADSTFADNIPVMLSGGKTFGKYGNGSVILAAGKTAQEVIIEALREVTPPTYNAPSASIGIDRDSNTLEVGETVTVGINVNYNQNDGGGITAVSIRRNGAAIASASPTSDTVKVSTNAINYDATVNYAQGPVKNDSAGNPYPTGRIQAGSAGTNTVSLRGFYKVFFGPAEVAPTNSAEVHFLPRSRFENAGNVFLLDTGNVRRIQAVAFPANKNLVSVVDLDALNANITSSYVVSTFNVNDADGQPVAYKVAVLTNAGPYPTPHFHQITIA